MKGNINVQTENIFPVIKKFLYSDHEIFLRELVSNAVDATQKLKTLSSMGKVDGDLGDLTIEVKLEKGKLIVIDRGIGMTSDEIEKYITQIAFSGAEEFLAKYKDKGDNLIGHFGLGFYSAFMVADKVEIKTKSYTDSPAMHWTCDGSPEYTMEECKKKDRGTEIILHITDDCKEFLEEQRILELLRKYCRFMPVAIHFGEESIWEDSETEKDKDGNPKRVEKKQSRIINNTEPAWRKKPADLTDEEYKKFYHELYPMNFEDPLFQIHLNVDYPFTLTGILYFPKVKKTIDPNRNKIQLYCNQVFVTDSVEGVVPDFLMLLHGVLDSPDIPLNVSRSYLQSDSNVKKISSHITKKVADSLQEIFKTDRTQFESKWDSLKIFISYGMLTDEKFSERAEKFNLFKNTEGKYFTAEEYKTLIESNQTDKDGNLIHLYTNDAEQQFSYIEAAKSKGYDVLLFDEQLDIHLASKLEQKNEKNRYVRVDADIVDKLILKDDKSTVSLSSDDQQALSEVFRSQTPKQDKLNFLVTFDAIGADAYPVMITQDEFMRRMKEMAAMQGGMMGFYGSMPDSYNLVVNTDHELVKSLLEEEKSSCSKAVKPKNDEIETLRKKVDE